MKKICYAEPSGQSIPPTFIQKEIIKNVQYINTKVDRGRHRQDMDPFKPSDHTTTHKIAIYI